MLGLCARPFGGKDPPAAMFCYSRDRSGEHRQAHPARYAGLFQADAFGGYTALYEGDRKPGPILEAACWVHARCPFFVLADLAELLTLGPSRWVWALQAIFIYLFASPSSARQSAMAVPAARW
jgi:hypothetical protein